MKVSFAVFSPKFSIELLPIVFSPVEQSVFSGTGLPFYTVPHI